MGWDELNGLFADTVGDTLEAAAIAEVARLVSRLDGNVKARAITAAYQAAPGWLGDERR
jgi:hypothetical protein